MMEGLRDFLARITAPRGEDELAGDDAALDARDFRIAATALLVHVADVDGEITEAERGRLMAILEARFGLDTAQAARLLRDAQRSEQEAVDLYHFTSLVKRRLNAEGRAKLIEMMWEIAYADGSVHEFEDNVVWRVAELMGVEARERVLLRQKVALQLGRPAEAAAVASVEAPSTTSGPWGRRPAEGA
jgi:uncharacterized tellurite resistance protein B-like protein